MYGITERVARQQGYMGEMRELPLVEAQRIAQKVYWAPYMCDSFSPAVAFQILDTAYNGGDTVRWMQMASGAVVDGILGPKTVAAVQEMDAKTFTLRFLSYRLDYLTHLGGWSSFGKGWARRIAKNLLHTGDK
jgi:lysozyme family protein